MTDLTGKKFKVIAKRAGFRRGGIAHSTTETVHDAKDFTAEQLKQIAKENGKNLMVTIVDESAKENVSGESKTTTKAKEPEANATETGAETGESADEGEADKGELESVVAACKQLIEKGEKTTCPNVTDIVGFNVSAALRDEALAQIAPPAAEEE